MHATLPIAAVIAAGIVYHLVQKASSSAASPWPILAIAYGVAFALTLGLALGAGDLARWRPGRSEWIAGVLLGVAAFGIEAGFYFIYRAGWSLGSASVIINAVVTIVLLAIGVVVFAEAVTPARAAGIGLAACGVALMVRG